MSPRLELAALRAAVAIAAAVPVTVGLWGVVGGLGAFGPFVDSHFRYLSGLLLGMGLMFWGLLPGIERWRWPFRALCALVVFGGLARLGAAIGTGMGWSVEAALTMELVVTPALFIWRESLDRRCRTTSVPVAGDE